MRIVCCLKKSYDPTTLVLRDAANRGAFENLAALLIERGAELWIACGVDAYRGDHRFGNLWHFNGVHFAPVDGEVTADLIYDRASYPLTAADHVINHPLLDQLCCDKLALAERWPAYFPHTQLIRDADEWQTYLGTIAADHLIVTKPQVGSHGTDVAIRTRRECEQSTIPRFPILAQEYIDTAAGIPGLTDATPFGHDLRIVMGNDTPLYAFLRTAIDERRIANVAQGGTLHEININAIPTVGIELAMTIDRDLATFGPRLYSIDLGFTARGPLLYELNSQPMLPRVPACIAHIADTLVAAARHHADATVVA